MLSRLFIKNYALIENLDMTFHEGLNIITGETGAGKSIIMGALGLILGNRVEGKHFFHADQKCIIEGYFDIDAYQLVDFFKENDLDYDSKTIIRREVASDGKSRAFVNDSPVTLAVLKSLGELLIDIHSQHATLQINTEKFQLLVLDSVAKDQALLTAYQEAFHQYKERIKELQLVKEELVVAQATFDFNQFQFEELDKVHLKEGEQKGLEDEQRQLENAEEIKRGLLRANFLLEEQEGAVTHSLKEAMNQLQDIRNYLPAESDLVDRLQSAFIEIKDIAQEITALEQDISMDEQRLSVVNDRLSELYNLQKKHRVDTVEELIVIKEHLEQQLLSVHNQEDRLFALEDAVEKSRATLEDMAQELHDARASILPQIEQYVQEMLREVGMPHAKLIVELSFLPLDKFKNNGADEVQFLFAANKGQMLQPIHKVASGGELSRVMLAVKSLVAQTLALPTIIFDEIDTGISGEVALKVGEIMERLAENMQVLSITHLPQIASRGQAHFKVYKQDDTDKTSTHIVLLDKEEKVMEVAQMLSGAQPGEAALKHARELIRG